MHAAAIVSNLRKCDEPAVKAATARAVHGALMPQRDAEPLAVQQRPPSQPLADDKGGNVSIHWATSRGEAEHTPLWERGCAVL